MLTKRVIPCLDVTGGRVVKGTRFLQLRDAGDPVESALAYNDQGADELVFLDITASSDDRRTMIDVVARTADQCFMPLTVGGGVRTVEDVRALLNAGADKVSVNTAALARPALIDECARAFGSQCVVLAVDAKREPPTPGGEEADPDGGPRAGRWSVYTHGGRKPAGRDVLDWTREAVNRGAGEILLTSMDTDGTKAGYDIELTARVGAAVGVPVIASGGAGTLAHLADVLTRGGADAVLAASIFHFGEHDVAGVKRYLAAQGIPVRPALESKDR